MSLPPEFAEKLKEIDGLVLLAQRRMAALRGEAELTGGLDPLVITLHRKSSALGHVREDLATVPEKVADAQSNGSGS